VGAVSSLDWVGWHRDYEDPGSGLHRRLLVVQAAVRDALAARRGACVRIVSVCAGQGHDLVGVLAAAGGDVRVEARLVELDPENVRLGRLRAEQAGIDGLEFVCEDASVTDAYEGAVPADLVLVCGVFGRIADADVRRTIEMLPQLCAASARVIWTRHRRAPDLTPSIRRWFAEAGFAERSFVSAGPDGFAVGVHELQAAPRPLTPGARLFTFTG